MQSPRPNALQHVQHLGIYRSEKLHVEETKVTTSYKG